MMALFKTNLFEEKRAKKNICLLVFKHNREQNIIPALYSGVFFSYDFLKTLTLSQTLFAHLCKSFLNSKNHKTQSIMKRLYSFMPLLALPLIFIFSGYNSGSPGGRSGSPGDNGNSCTGCHTGTPQNATNWISTTIPAIGYIGGETYVISLTGTHPSAARFGFELTAEDNSGSKVGAFNIINTQTQLVNSNKAVTHTSQGTTPVGTTKTWEFEWTAPETVPGDITFYAAVNAANGNGNTNGDVIFLTQKTYGIDVTDIAENTQEFKFYPNPSTGPVNFQVPTFGNGNTVKVYDQAGRIIEQVNVNGISGSLDLSSHAKGLYFVQLDNDIMQKLILK